MQQWELVLQKASLCVCPKEAPVNVFKQDITAHLAILKDQACFFLHVRQGMLSWQSKESGTAF